MIHAEAGDMFNGARAIDKTRAAFQPIRGQEVSMPFDPREVATLNPVEWRAVAIALQDADRDVWQESEPGTLRNWLGRLYSRLTGSMPVPRLADPRLDTLRRFVHAARRSREKAEPLVPAMMAQGFNRLQIEVIATLSA